MQIDGISSVPAVSSISSAQQIDGQISRATYQSSESAAYGQGISTRPVGPRPRPASLATTKRSSSAPDDLDPNRIEETDVPLGSILDEIA